MNKYKLIIGLFIFAMILLVCAMIFVVRGETSATLGEYQLRLDSGKPKDGSNTTVPGLLVTFLSPKPSDKNKSVSDVNSVVKVTHAGIEITIHPLVRSARSAKQQECGLAATCVPDNYVMKFIPLNEQLTSGEDFEKPLVIHVDGTSQTYKLVGEDHLLRLFAPDGQELKIDQEIQYP